MPYVVIDLEFNNMQGVAGVLGEYLDGVKDKNRYLYPNEIIQIGAVRLDNNQRVEKELNIFVKHRFFRKLNPFISEMTGITEENINSGIGYEYAIKELKEFCNGAYIYTWGIPDIYEIIRNCHMHSLKFMSLGTDYLDLQEFVASRYFEGKTPSLKNAMLKFNIPMEDEKLHDGLYDAQCTAKILESIIREGTELEGYINSNFLFGQDAVYIPNVKIRDVPDKEITVLCPLCEGKVIYDVSMSNEHGKINSMYHCENCRSSFSESISIKENMTRNRKYFKKIKKIPLDYYKLIVKQRQKNKNNKYY